MGAARSRRPPNRRSGRAIVVAAIGMLALCSGLVGTAIANEGDPQPGTEDQIVLNGRLRVLEDERVETAVIFNGPATVDGTVGETLVAFNGDVNINGTVEGDVVAFNGAVTIGPGAVVRGDVISRSTPQVDPDATVGGTVQGIGTRVDFADIGLAGRIAWWFGYSISTLILGLVLLLLAPGLDASLSGAWRDRLGASVGWGVAAFFLLPIVAVLLLAIIIAIPLGLFLLLGLALLYTAGYVAGTHVVGRRILTQSTSRFVAFLLGWAIVRALALIPVVGGLLWLVVAVLGLGALLAAGRGAVATRPTAPTPSMPPVPPAPA